jgi:excinuclease ABC subunit B
LSDYLREMGVKVQYLHSEVETLERTDILRDLRLGVYDVVVGVNLLREGLDLPEVTLVAILDADKEGYLRSGNSLIQVIGRAARHVEGHVIMYADRVTDSMRFAIDETQRRRDIQQDYNRRQGIDPQTVVKAIRDINARLRSVAEELPETPTRVKDMPRDELFRLIRDIESRMKSAAKDLDFEKAALLRDELIELRGVLAGEAPIAPAELEAETTRRRERVRAVSPRRVGARRPR